MRMVVNVNFDWLGIAALVVAIFAGILEWRHHTKAEKRLKELKDQLATQTIDFELKRNAFTNYMHGRKDRPGGLDPHEREQVDNQLSLFGPPRTSLSSPPSLMPPGQ
jgi:hypothetical protein